METTTILYILIAFASGFFVALAIVTFTNHGFISEIKHLRKKLDFTERQLQQYRHAYNRFAEKHIDSDFEVITEGNDIIIDFEPLSAGESAEQQTQRSER